MNHKTFLESLIRQTARQDKGSALGKDFHEGSPTAYHGQHPEDDEYWGRDYGHQGRRNRGFQVRSAQDDVNLLDPDHDPNLRGPDDFHDDGTEAQATSPAIHHAAPAPHAGYSSDTGSFHQQAAPGGINGKLKARMDLIRLNKQIADLTRQRDQLKADLQFGDSR